MLDSRDTYIRPFPSSERKKKCRHPLPGDNDDIFIHLEACDQLRASERLLDQSSADDTLPEKSHYLECVASFVHNREVARLRAATENPTSRFLKLPGGRKYG